MASALPIRAERTLDMHPDEADAFWVKMYRTPTTATIASGILTTTGWGYYAVETQGAAATDDLDRINGVPEGEEILLCLFNAAHRVTLKHGTFLKLPDGLDFELQGPFDNITLKSKGGDVLFAIGLPVRIPS